MPAWPAATRNRIQNNAACVSAATSFIALSAPVRCGTSNKPNQYSGRNALTESNHQPLSGTANNSPYSSAWPARAASTCQRGIEAGSSGRGSSARQARRSSASASIVRPSDLWKL